MEFCVRLFCSHFLFQSWPHIAYLNLKKRNEKSCTWIDWETLALVCLMIANCNSLKHRSVPRVTLQCYRGLVYEKEAVLWEPIGWNLPFWRAASLCLKWLWQDTRAARFSCLHRIEKIRSVQKSDNCQSLKRTSFCGCCCKIIAA